MTSDELRALRESCLDVSTGKPITQIIAAALMGIERRHYSHMERGVRPIPPYIAKLARYVLRGPTIDPANIPDDD